MAGGIPNSLYRVPILHLLLACALCFGSFLLVVFFVVFCFRFHALVGAL